MSRTVVTIREWLPAVLVVCALTLTTSYAVLKKTSAAQDISELENLGALLSDAAELAENGALSQEETDRLTSQRKKLEDRMADTLEPSLVQAELMKSATKAGLVLREIYPTKQPGTSTARNKSTGYPRYRVLVAGSYTAISEYMQLCSRQRLPARVREFQVRPSPSEAGERSNTLVADIVVEAFRQESQVKEEQGSQRWWQGKRKS